MTRAVVVFHGHRTRRWWSVLKPGFRHCFVAVERGGYWILFDPKEGCPELRVLAGTDFDLATFYRQCGCAVVETSVRDARFVSPFIPATCVAAVKRVIGLYAPSVLTPWQLFRRLDAVIR